MSTANDLIALALKAANVLGVGQPASAEDSTDCLRYLNQMLAQWSRKKLLVYKRTDVSLASTGASSYSIGPGQQFNTARPARIESAFARQTGVPLPADYPLHVIQAQEEYNRVFIKTLSAFPAYVFYDGNYPTGTVYFWPVPSTAFELHLSVLQPLASIANLADTVNLPPEYEEAIIYNLAQRLYVHYGLPPNPMTARLASAALKTIKEINDRTPSIVLSADVAGGTRYNIYGDTVR